MSTKTSKSAKFKDTMRPKYDMTGGVRGKYASRPKVDEQVDKENHSRVGFDPSLRDVFKRICDFIASAGGCNADLQTPTYEANSRCPRFTRRGQKDSQPGFSHRRASNTRNSSQTPQAIWQRKK